MAGYGSGGYGRAPSKSKPATLTQLEERNKRLREENAAMVKKVEDFEDQQSRFNVTIAHLSGEAGSLGARAHRLEQQTEEQEWEFADMKAKMEVEIGTICEERDAWQRRVDGFAAAAEETNQELTELDELATRGVKERRQLQSECLSLQQECEDARVELQETRDLLRQSGSTVERMVRQKLDLEWELQDQTTKHKVLRTMLTHAGHELAHEADDASRQREMLVAASRIELDRERATAESYRVAAIANQREVTAMMTERVRLEREATAQRKEIERLEALRKEFEEEVLQEHYREGKTKEIRDRAAQHQKELAQQLQKLELQSHYGNNIVADSQEDQAKTLLSKAQKQAQDMLAAPFGRTDSPSGSEIPKRTKSFVDGVAMADDPRNW